MVTLNFCGLQEAYEGIIDETDQLGIELAIRVDLKSLAILIAQAEEEGTESISAMAESPDWGQF